MKASESLARAHDIFVMLIEFTGSLCLYLEFLIYPFSCFFFFLC